MSEKLIPFDFDEFVKDPSRLRHREDGVVPDIMAPVFGNAVAVRWCATKTALVYLPSEFDLLRLAAKTRKVRVRLYRISGTGAISVATNLTGANLDTPGVYPWISDPVEIEVME